MKYWRGALDIASIVLLYLSLEPGTPGDRWRIAFVLCRLCVHQIRIGTLERQLEEIRGAR